jgi:hypothetical protein
MSFTHGTETWNKQIRTSTELQVAKRAIASS